MEVIITKRINGCFLLKRSADVPRLQYRYLGIVQYTIYISYVINELFSLKATKCQSQILHRERLTAFIFVY